MLKQGILSSCLGREVLCKSKDLSTAWTDLEWQCVNKGSILNVSMLLTELMHEIAQSQALRQPRQLYIKDTFQHYTRQINDTRYTQQAVNTSSNQNIPYFLFPYSSQLTLNFIVTWIYSSSSSLLWL